MENDEYISLEVLAACLRLPQKYLRELAGKNLIPSLDVHGRLRFDEVAVRQALAKIARRRPNTANGKA